MHGELIIGAGPAGCIAAILLARGGRKVTLIEQHRFPREKVCGECLSSLGQGVLERLGFRELLNSLGAVPLKRACLHDQRGLTRALPLPRTMWGISRSCFDQALLNLARDAGGIVLQPARCEGLQCDAEAPVAEVRDLSTNRVQVMTAAHVFIAEGKGSLLPHRPRPTADLGIKGHFIDVNGPRDAVELFALPGHYTGLAAIEQQRWNLAMSIPADRVAEVGGDVDRLLCSMMQQNPVLRSRLTGARRVGRWLTSPLPRFSVRSGWPARVIPLGNAAAALEPIGGEGMGLAMRSAEIAATHLLDRREIDPALLRRQFKRLWRVRLLVARATAIAMSTPAFAHAGIGAAPACFDEVLLRWMGKHDA
jgi:menaquinone-9 beta-reductase